MVLLTSCTKKEIVRLKTTDQIISTTELSDIKLEKEFQEAVSTAILFSDEMEYERFEQRYFKLPNTESHLFDFDKYDLLLVNGKTLSSNEDTLYSIDSIKNLGDDVEIFLKEDGKVKTEINQDVIIKNIIYVRLNKGTISSKSNFKILKNKY